VTLTEVLASSDAEGQEQGDALNAQAITEVHRQLSRIPRFAGTPPEAFAIEGLGGLTNKNYKVIVDDESYMLRIAGEGTGEYIDRKAEAVNAKVAIAAGVNVEVLFFEAGNGLQLTRFIEGAATLDAERFKNMDSVARAACAFRKIHSCGDLFANEFNIFTMVDEYLVLLKMKGALIPDGYEEVQAEAEAVRAALASRPAGLVPCHCDPVAENFLDTGERMYIVDWEYAGNNDPMWDLGALSVEAEFDADQDAALMESYFEGQPPADQVGRMVMYKAMSDLLWILWAVIQVVNENPAEDFRAYGVGRFERCKALMASPVFAEHLAAACDG